MKAIKLVDINAQLPRSKRVIKYLTEHCTAGWQDETNEQLFEGFKANGWNNPGYHVTVDPDGTAWVLQHPDLVANGVAGFNANNLHISYKGGIARNGVSGAKNKIVPVDNRTEAQKATMLMIMKHWRSQYPKAKIMGHRDFSTDKNKDGKITPDEYIKQCPCHNAQDTYRGI
jgi:N-acetylmuramoyl-L-alanine amidase